MTPFDALVGALAGLPALPGARCRGQAAMFDPARRGEGSEVSEARHKQALGLCQRCPALDPCRLWFDGLSACQRPRGVIAGKVYQPVKGSRPE